MLYVYFLMPGIFAQSGCFGAIGTAVGLSGVPVMFLLVFCILSASIYARMSR
jgi:hypothetical protein